MITLNTIFQRAGPAYRAQPDVVITPQQRRAMLAIERCRTEALGGQVFTCPSCQTTRYSYHSCRNRHCPTCQQDAGQAWLAAREACLLPVPYFLITFTIPAALRDVARANPRQVYTALFRASAAALQQLAADPRFLGGQLGMLGVLHTWTRDLRYHPHIHYLVPAVALAPDGRVVQPPAADFLLPVRPLAILYRAKLQASLRQYPFAAAIVPAMGRGLPSRWHGGNRAEVSRAVCVSGGAEQQPHPAGRRRSGHVSLSAQRERRESHQHAAHHDLHPALSGAYFAVGLCESAVLRAVQSPSPRRAPAPSSSRPVKRFR